MITGRRKILSRSIDIGKILTIKKTFLIVSILPISINVGAVGLIIQKRQFQRARFYIIANLSVVDTLTLLVLCIGAIKRLFQDNNIEENTEDIFNITVGIIGTSSASDYMF